MNEVAELREEIGKLVRKIGRLEDAERLQDIEVSHLKAALANTLELAIKLQVMTHGETREKRDQAEVAAKELIEEVHGLIGKEHFRE